MTNKGVLMKKLIIVLSILLLPTLVVRFQDLVAISDMVCRNSIRTGEKSCWRS